MYSKTSFSDNCLNNEVTVGPKPGPDSPIGFKGLSLGPLDPKGPPKNCGTRESMAGI